MQFAAKGEGGSSGSHAVLGILHEPHMIYYIVVPECPLRLFFFYLSLSILSGLHLVICSFLGPPSEGLGSQQSPPNGAHFRPGG